MKNGILNDSFGLVVEFLGFHAITIQGNEVKMKLGDYGAQRS